MNGLELTRAIRGRPEGASLPVVIVTSLGSDDDRQAGVEAGANAYMVKRRSTSMPCSTPSSGSSALDGRADPSPRLRRLEDLRRGARPHARAGRRDRGGRRNATAEAAIADLARLAPDLVTMDIELPGMSGLERSRRSWPRSRRRSSSCRLTRLDSDVAAAALASGALEAIGKEGSRCAIPTTRPRSPSAAG